MLAAPLELFDLSVPVMPGMAAWPADRASVSHRVIAQGDDAAPRDSEWTLNSHAGTHLDAPLHWINRGRDVESIPLESCVGPCTVVAAEGEGAVAAEQLPEAALNAGHRILLKTSNSERRVGSGKFEPDFVSIGQSAARRIAEAGVALVGLDYMSVEAYGGNGEVHRILLGAGVVLLEGLDLRGVGVGVYNLCALPLRLRGGEASPVRAVLWR